MYNLIDSLPPYIQKGSEQDLLRIRGSLNLHRTIMGLQMDKEMMRLENERLRCKLGRAESLLESENLD